jgi:twitching motility protein PilJ
VRRDAISLAKDRLHQVLTNVVGLQGRVEVSQEVSFQVTKDIASFSAFLKDMEEGNKADGIEPLNNPQSKAALMSVKLAFESGAKANLLSLAGDMNSVQDAKELGAGLFKLSDSLLKNATAIAAQIQVSKKNQVFWLLSVVAGLGLMALGAFHILMIKNKDDKRVAREATAKAARDDTALRNLIVEMGGLGVGDLSIHATENSGTWTDEVAKAVNSNVSDLRDLVGRVRKTSDDVSNMVATTSKTADQLGQMADEQEKTIDKVSGAMGEMSQKLDDVAQQTSMSADLASKAVQLSRRGEGVVGQTIAGMHAIRENIQETSKRIKSLGEASQQIGEVTQVIRAVGGRIQILALNASIQAANAGEAGKGFAVVAEEIQQLSEEAAHSVQRIDKLVLKIQSSAKETISNMEQTTQRVVEGAMSADNAGKALHEIGEAAEKLQKTVLSVTNEMQQGTEDITDIAIEIGQVKTMARRTKEGVKSANQTVSKMDGATKTLQQSVENFRLEDGDSGELSL